MTKKRLYLVLISTLLVATMALAACSCPPQETPTPTEEPMAELGSEERPIQVYFVPSTEASKIVAGGEIMAQALEQATGLKFEVYVPTSYAAFVEGMCAAGGDAMGFPATFAYVVANARCGIEPALRSVRYGDSFYYAEILVPRDSDAQAIEDLADMKWAYTDATSTSGHIVPMIMLAAAGVEPSEKVATGGHPQAVLALYNGEADFASAFFNSPQSVVEGVKWQAGDPLEPYADVVDECVMTEDGSDIQCGDWLVKDARRNVRDTTGEDVVKKLRTLAISDPIPNDCLAFGKDFPADLRQQIVDALLAFKETEEWDQSIGDFYTWQDVVTSTDADYASIRDQIEQAGFSMDEVVGFLEE
jgi:phosphonate transport system substrate-binding protein